MKRTALVTNATGRVGARVASSLLERGFKVRALEGSPSRLVARPRLSACTIDRQRASDYAAAVEGCDAVVLTPPMTGDEPLAIETDVAAAVSSAAKRSGVEHLVVHTALHAERAQTGVPFLENKGLVERAVRRAGVPYTIIRPGMFIEPLLLEGPQVRSGAIMFPFPADKRIGAVSVPDVAKAAVEAVVAGPANRAFDLHFPDGVACLDMCDAATEILGQQFDYAEYRARPRDFVETFDMGPAEKGHYAAYLEYVRRIEYVGSPRDILMHLPKYRYSTPERVIRTALRPEPVPILAAA